MPNWPRNPTIFEISAWVWLSSLSKKYGTGPSLEHVPTAEWDGIAEFGFDSVWLMGVWKRSPAGFAIANRNDGLLNDFRRALWADAPMSVRTRTCALSIKLLARVNQPVFRDGTWRLCERTSWPDNQRFRNLVAWCWLNGDDRYLIVVNLSEGAVQALYTCHGMTYGKKLGG